MKQGDATFSPIPPPLGLLLRVLAIVFLAEVSVMFLLPALLPHMHTLAAAIVDAAMLTVLSAPFLWWVVVRPLRSTAMAEHARAATVVAHAVDGIITINKQGLVQSFNPAAERIFGYRAEEVLGKPLTLVMPERYRDAHRRGLERMRSTGKSDLIGKTIGLQGLRKDGREFELELSLATWKAGTETSYYTGIVRDITERKRAEAQLRLQVAALEAAANVIAITDREGRILWVNPAFTRLTGYTSEEAVGQTPRLLKSGRQDLAFYQNLWATILAGRVWHGEIINRRKDGSLYTEEQTITPVRDARGEISHFIGIREDITAQKQAEQALITRTRQLEAVRAVSAEITRELDLPTLLGLIHRRAAELVGAVSGVVYLWDEAAQLLVPQAWHGIGDWFKEMRLRLGEGIAGMVAERRTGMIVNDYRSWPHAIAFTLERSGITAIIAEPLLYRDRLLGGITSNAEQSKGSFTENDRELLALFATQAAMAIENARLYAATEARAAELETFREIDQAITARLELSAVLEAVVAGAMRLLDTQHAQIILWDEATQSLHYGAALGTEAERVRNQKFKLGLGINGTVALTRQPMILDDYQASPYAVPECFDVVATITVPVLFEDRLLGVLHAHTTTQDKRFTADDLRRFEMLAGQAAIAIEQARLYEATVRQLRELRALYESGLAITSSLTLDEQLEVLIQRLGQVAQAQRILVALVDPGAPERFRLCLAYDTLKPDPWLRHLDLSPGRYPELQEAVRTGRPLVIPDVPTEARLDAIRDHLKHLDLRSLIVVPFIVQERAIGAVSLGYVGQSRTFPPEEISLLQSFATQAAIAIEKARLYQEIQHHAAELEQRVHERTRELEAANEQLQAASRHKSEFLANMSHELRTPLNSIIGFAELVGEQRVGPLNDKQARYLGHIHQAGQHLLQLINDILDLAKVEAGKVVLRPEALPVADTLEDILVIGRGLANKKGQTVMAEIQANLSPLHADPVRFKQTLFNLLSNAVKFTPEGGTITVRAYQKAEGTRQKAQGSVQTSGELPPLPTAECLLPTAYCLLPSLVIEVTDTGIGIKAADLPRLFQEFVQLETSATQRHEGTGLGLALTKRLVDLHGGRIWAESAGEARGSTFTVLLPFRGPREGQGTSPGPTSSGGREWSEEEAGE